MTVTFDSYRVNDYTKYGFNIEDDVVAELYWSKPEIIAPPRPKTKVKKVVEAWANVYPDYLGICHYITKEKADQEANFKRIACVKLTGVY